MTEFNKAARTNPLSGQPPLFTPQSRLGKFSGPDPMVMSAGRETVDIQLDDGEEYSLDGFAAGVYRVLWTDDASEGGKIEKYAEFQAYITELGAKAVKVMDAETVGRHTNTEDVVAVVPATPANDGAVAFFVDNDDNLVLQNGSGTDGTDGRVFELARLR